MTVRDPFQQWQAANGHHVTTTDADGDEVHVPEQCPRCIEDARRAR